MATRFCINCGHRLADGDAFCPECGQPVLQDESEVTESQSAQQPPDQPQNPAATQRMPQVSPAEQTNAPQDSPYSQPQNVQPPQPVRPAAAPPQYAPYGAPQQASSNRRPWYEGTAGLVVTIVAAIIAVIAIGLLVFHFVIAPKTDATDKPQDAASSSQSSASTSDASDSASSAAVDDSSSSSSSDNKNDDAADAKFANTLRGYYNQLPEYDSRIKDVASTFNSSYLTASFADRTNYAGQAQDLYLDVEAKVTELKSMTVPSDSAYAEQYALILQCYEDHAARLSCMVEAWNIDVQYPDNPRAHQNEILQPISSNNLGNGVNKNLDDYNKTYPKISL